MLRVHGIPRYLNRRESNPAISTLQRDGFFGADLTTSSNFHNRVKAKSACASRKRL